MTPPDTEDEREIEKKWSVLTDYGACIVRTRDRDKYVA